MVSFFIYVFPTNVIIDKVHIDGPCGSKTLAGVLLVRFERVSHVTHFYR